MESWTPGEEELAVILGFAREAELNTSLIERVVPNARSGERKRKVAHIIACCEQALDAIAEEARNAPKEDHKVPTEESTPDEKRAHNKRVILEGVEAAAKAAGE